MARIGFGDLLPSIQYAICVQVVQADYNTKVSRAAQWRTDECVAILPSTMRLSTGTKLFDDFDDKVNLSRLNYSAYNFLMKSSSARGCVHV